MKKTGLLLKLICWFGLVGALTFCAGMTAIASPEGVMLKRSAYEDSVTQFNRFKITVPAGAADREITVTEVEPDLKGIRQPFNFKPVSKMFRFGPDGIKFSKGKELRFNITLDANQEGARLYYINREKSRLDLVEGQSYQSKTHRLEARLRHFSDYVLGISAGWDGNGLNPFSDYITNGIETVDTYMHVKPRLRLNVYSAKGRGMDLDFTIVSEETPSSVYSSYCQLYGIGSIAPGLRLDIPFLRCTGYDGNNKLDINIPGKGLYPAYYGINPTGSGTGSLTGWSIYNYNGNSFAAKVIKFVNEFHDDNTDITAHNIYEPMVYLSDGRCIKYYSTYETVTDPNGNMIKYTYHCQHYPYIMMDDLGSFDYGPNKILIDTIEDTMGRMFYFSYNEYGNLTQIRQKLFDNSMKPVVTLSYSGKYSTVLTVTDAVGRVYTISFESLLNDISNYANRSPRVMGVSYPNGVRSEYTYGDIYLRNIQEGYYYEELIKSQKWYKPNQSSPFRVVTYGNVPEYQYEDHYVAVNDGITKKVCYFSNSGSVVTKNVYSAASGKLLKTVVNEYNTLRASTEYGSELLISAKTRLYKNDGSAGEAIIWRNEYDNWGNITKVTDPNGSATLMAYANTSSNPNLATVNPSYQNSLYTSGAAWNQMLTKATLVKDPVHGSTQLKQTHFKYDTSGNLLQEDAVFGGGYLKTKYTYDSYGNLLTKTDANGNTINFEYADTTEKPYKSAYLTRMYKPDGTTVAGYWYNFDTGNKTMATDPKGNVFRYEYDAVNRLTKEWQDNSDPKIGITRQIIYDDANSTVALKFGNDTAGWQEGFIYYDPLFGKPATLQRKINGSWITQKQFEYDSNGRLAWEKDGMGHQTTYQYDALDRKTQFIQPDGSTTQFAYDDRTVITTDANGNKKERTYDLLDRLVGVKESPDKRTTFYTTTYTYDTFYDNSGNKPVYQLVKAVNPKNAETINTYDNLGRLTRTDYPQNLIAAETFTYDNVGNLKTKTNSKGTKTLDYEFFAGYRLKQVTEPGGKIVSYTYDANDNPLTQTTNGVTYSYKYDARNRVTNLDAKLDTELFKLVYDYDSFSRVTGIAYPGRTTPVNYSYDELDRLQTIPGFVNSCDYDEDNKLTEMQLSNGVRNIFAYDQNDRPIKITANKNSAIGNAVFSRTSTAYKTNGAQVTINQPRFESSAPGFGKAALIEYRTTVTPSNPFFKSGVTDWTLTTADGATATKASVTGGSFGGKTAKITITKGGTANNHIEFYKSIGSVTAGQQIACQIRIKSSVSTDKAVLQCMNNVSPGENFGNITLNLTTEFQRFEIIATSTLAGTARISLYLGNVPTGTAIEIDYIGCEIGRAYTTSPHDGSRSIENLKIPTAGISPTAGTWEQLVYINPVLKMKGTSRWDRIFSIPLPNGEPAICVYHDGVDGAWDLETHNDSGQGSWLPAMISDSVTNEGEWYRFRITWSPTQAVLQIYSVSSGSKVAEQKRTSPKLPTSFGPYAYVGNAGEHSFTNSIHDDIRVSSIVRTDVFDATKPLPVDENTIYKANLDDSLELLSGGLMNLNYEYDPVGNITRMNNDYFDYDGLNRLIWYGNAPDAFQSGANGIQWSYDGAGNMTGRLKYQNGQIQENITLGYDMANRLLNAGSITYTNSMVGERLTKTTGDVSWNYSYDGESRLTKVTKGSTTLVEGFYDGAGMRYKKVENGKTTYYIYSGSNPLVEYTPTDGKYTYRIYAGKSAVAEEKGGVVKYFHKDHLGSTRVVTDANGNKVAEYKYAPYGEKEISTGNGTDYQFTDKANDESTGLTYFGARFYDPEVGRFITPDTYTNLPNDERNFFITNENGFMARSDDPAKYNQYAYCQNNPINRVDPDGHFAFAIVFAPEIIHATIMGVGAAYVAYEGIKSMIKSASKDWDHWEKVQEKYDRKAPDRMRSSDAKAREKKQIRDTLGKKREEREEASKNLHKDKEGGGNDRNKSYEQLKDYKSRAESDSKSDSRSSSKDDDNDE